MMINKNDKIFLAGHNGMIGSAILKKLTKDGFKRIITVNKKKLDLRNQSEVYNFIKSKKPKATVIAAAKVGGIYANNTFRAEFLLENLKINLNLFDALKEYQNLKVINLGSSCIYPLNAPNPINENSFLEGKLEPTNSPYAIAKITGIELGREIYNQYGNNVLNLMPTNLYGPNDNFHEKNSHFIPALIKKFVEAKRKKKNHVEIWGSGSPKREVMHVDDLSSAIVFILEKKITNCRKLKNIIKENSLINVGLGQEFTIKEFAKIINKITNTNKLLKFNRKFPDGTKRKVLDLTYIKKLGWKSKISLKDGLKSTIKWYQSNY